MREVKVAIVSKRRELARFLELEALNFDFKVSIFDKLAIDLGDFDLLIVDTVFVSLYGCDRTGRFVGHTHI